MYTRKCAVMVGFMALLLTQGAASQNPSRPATRTNTANSSVHIYAYPSNANRLMIVNHNIYSDEIGEEGLSEDTSDIEFLKVFRQLKAVLGVSYLPGAARRVSFRASRYQTYTVLLDCPGEFRPIHIGTFDPNLWESLDSARTFLCNTEPVS